MLVGWGGNNGTTVTAGLLANKHGLTWETKDGIKKANWWVEIRMKSIVKIDDINNQCKMHTGMDQSHSHQP